MSFQKRPSTESSKVTSYVFLGRMSETATGANRASNRKPSILEADDFVGACYRKAMTPPKAIDFGANREKPTVKKLINNEMFFFTVYIPYKP